MTVLVDSEENINNKSATRASLIDLDVDAMFFIWHMQGIWFRIGCKRDYISELDLLLQRTSMEPSVEKKSFQYGCLSIMKSKKERDVRNSAARDRFIKTKISHYLCIIILFIIDW